MPLADQHRRGVSDEFGGFVEIKSPSKKTKKTNSDVRMVTTVPFNKPTVWELETTVKIAV